jgi:hypothetical protein
MRRLFLARLALSLGFVALLLSPSPANAQKKGERAKFETCDGVELHGLFYPSSQGPKATCVILLHNVANSSDTHNSQQDGWDRLATSLQEHGYAVLSFDFRGHGNSTSVQSNFWKAPQNSGVRGAKGKETIEAKDFPRNYWPVLTNDIAAAKTFLDRRNDEGQCNSRNIILIGAQNGAVLGSMWLAAEMHRYEVINPIPLRLDVNPEGKSVKACVWISMSPNFWPGLDTWLKFEGKEKKIPMAFVYGENDSTAANFAKKWGKDLKGEAGPTKKFTGQEGIKKSNLAGHKLLRKDLDTVSWITKYLDDLSKDLTLDDYAKVEFDKKGYMWNFMGGRPIPAKIQAEKLLHPIPLSNIGVR